MTKIFIVSGLNGEGGVPVSEINSISRCIISGDNYYTAVMSDDTTMDISKDSYDKIQKYWDSREY